MKKVITLCLCALTAISAMAAKDGKAHWSLGIKGGIDYYRLAPQYCNKEVKNAAWDAGIDLIYDVNPYFGLGLNAGWASFNRDAINGGVLDADVFTTINMTNLLAPNRQNNWKKFNFYTNVGLGCGTSFARRYTNDDAEYVEDYEHNSAPYARLGLNAEVSLTKCVGMFFEGNYKLYMRHDFIDKAFNNRMFTDGVEANIGFRFRFGAGKKEHIRNSMPATSDNSEQIAALAAEVEALKAAANNNDDVDALKKQIEDLKKQSEAADENLQNQIDDLKKSVGQAIDNGGTVTLEGVTFAFSSSELTNDSRKVLDEVAKALEANKNWDVVYVNGYSDNMGPESYNKTLSAARAKSVAEYLAGKGIPASKMKSAGYGSENPIATNQTAEGRAKNRRVELSFSK